MYDVDARRIVTNPCLIAMDVDDTLVVRGDVNFNHFREIIAPQLAKCAELGFTLAFISGNALDAIQSRLVYPLVAVLKSGDRINLLTYMHFFCNGGAAHFILTGQSPDVKLEFTHNFLRGNNIPAEDVEAIEEVLRSTVRRLARTHLIPRGTSRRSLVEHRYITEGQGQASVPIQSTLHLHIDAKNDPTGDYLRQEIVRSIERALCRAGLTEYAVRCGGRASIDVSRSHVTKAFAIKWLVNQLNSARCEPGTSSAPITSVLYIGDEVTKPYGNDFPVLEVPDLIAISVDADPTLPLHSRVLHVPNLSGPSATADMLSRLVETTRGQLSRVQSGSAVKGAPCDAIHTFAKEQFAERTANALKAMQLRGRLDVKSWQSLCAAITLLERNDYPVRELLGALTDELDEIQQQRASL